jgi:acyl dehydratase
VSTTTPAGVIHVASAADLQALRGRPLVCPQTLTLTQERIDQFARATDDFQWIHVDAQRAARESPFKATIAHGFLSLALLTWFLERTVVFDGLKMGLNYGLDRVRFVKPAPAGAGLRGRFTLAEIETHAWGTQLHWDAMVTDEADAARGWNKPVLAARWLTRRYA